MSVLKYIIFKLCAARNWKKGDTITEYVILFISQILPKCFGLKDHVITSQKTRAFSKALLQSQVSKCTYY